MRIYWFLTIMFGLIYTWVFRFYVQSDTIAYLDIASEVAGGHAGALLNAYWSPFYPLLLSALNLIPGLESGLLYQSLHLVNFMGYLG
ncbi:MAG TPA: hypothetical protein VFV50_13785, partial [Bdellovibrionales bacterium]|nr:hypothetical protein [Bdellovibrionales bacterium]